VKAFSVANLSLSSCLPSRLVLRSFPAKKEALAKAGYPVRPLSRNDSTGTPLTLALSPKGRGKKALAACVETVTTWLIEIAMNSSSSPLGGED